MTALQYKLFNGVLFSFVAFTALAYGDLGMPNNSTFFISEFFFCAVGDGNVASTVVWRTDLISSLGLPFVGIVLVTRCRTSFRSLSR